MDNFTCQDIGLASYIKSFGIEVEDLIKEYNHFLFVFTDKKRCEQLANEWWNAKAVGNIKKYEEEKQTLISMIKNKR